MAGTPSSGPVQLIVKQNVTRTGPTTIWPATQRQWKPLPVDAAALAVGRDVIRHDQRKRIRHRLDALELPERLRLGEEPAAQCLLIPADQIVRG